VILQLADQQSKVLLNQDALLNYHIACVPFRVMEPMLPKKFINRQHSKLLYAIGQLKKLSGSCNFMNENSNNNSLAYQEMLCKNLISGHVHDVYRIYENQLLGKGTYGSVYLATHRETGSQRAVKILNFDRINSYNVRKIHNEIILLTKLNHANIIKLHDVYYGNKAVYIITDVCHGKELFECVKSGFVFDEDKVSKLMHEMLSAVNYLHQNGVVHRDIKLENFIFADSSHDSRLILIDFGLSKLIDYGEQLNQVVGSCYYTAPEVLNRCYDTKCDIWSIGIICYMLLIGILQILFSLMC